MAVTGFKKAYLDDYLKTLTNTSVFQLAYNYLVAKGVASSDFPTFYTQLFNLWYGTYSRCSSNQGSSGIKNDKNENITLSCTKPFKKFPLSCTKTLLRL